MGEKEIIIEERFLFMIIIANRKKETQRCESFQH